ncbi:helix-turn-helix domain-containing protein [Paenibacillus sp. VCA1]|uniref:helix-turn-helix domain-containing protein n=1 Tax=Paenibacillus sp. VCA1 TaxID=3039148 RepID=UPI0028724D18|nr:helix-turn-helix domain-containing protein [Paenibacillus sp. VCA1]MDR9857775.1 helix-turn-helix domain-containing protein [Paenibacillus sp. VCA1]
MTTADFIEALRADLKRELTAEILSELQPEIKKALRANTFTFEEACVYLKVSESTLRRMVRNREIPYFRQRNQLYFRQIDLDKHIESILVQKGD